MSASFAGKTVLVTGASRGIGLAVARRFAASGARVGLVATSAQLLADAAAGIDGEHVAVAADLTDPAECARAVAEVAAALGPIDVLISCAGVLRRDFVEDVKPADFEQSYRLHAGAAIWLAQAALPAMRERGYGRIVLVSSELGLFGGPSYASYSSSKWAMVGLGEVLGHELSGSGVRATVVCPGDVNTDQLGEEHEWGPTGGVAPEKAMSADYAARAIVRATERGKPLVVIDRPQMRVAFWVMRRAPRLRMPIIADAYKKLTRERRSISG
ncbi:MAG TPA: SDR family NAD(P)-dependent oxidoreductase [Solirubrobacteraceae bacterium]|nr:SDR family NAD(P)-dependent oxidoreductase [Solirubrobacteraceae bacterium]